VQASRLLVSLLFLAGLAFAASYSVTGPDSVSKGQSATFTGSVDVGIFDSAPCAFNNHIYFIVYDGAGAELSRRDLGILNTGQSSSGSITKTFNTEGYGTGQAILSCVDGSGNAYSTLASKSFSYSATGGGGGSGGDPAPAPALSLSVNPQDPTVDVGDTVYFFVKCLDGSRALTNCPASVRASTRNASVATVVGGTQGAKTAEFTVPVVGQGTTFFSATSGGLSTLSAINVKPSVASLTVTPASSSFVVRAFQQMTATCKDRKGAPMKCSVTWTSSNPGVARVSQTGRVDGVAAGTATITASAGGKTATSAVRITAAGGGGGGGGGYKGPKLRFKVGDSDVALEEVIGVAALVFVVLLVVYKFFLGGKLGKAPRRL
jgi:hypothetical protein